MPATIVPNCESSKDTQTGIITSRYKTRVEYLRLYYSQTTLRDIARGCGQNCIFIVIAPFY